MTVPGVPDTDSGGGPRYLNPGASRLRQSVPILSPDRCEGDTCKKNPDTGKFVSGSLSGYRIPGSKYVTVLVIEVS